MTQRQAGLLVGKVALITGGASGIGRATAQLFAIQGAKVVAVDINGPEVQKTVDKISAQGGDALALRTDVGSFGDVKAMIKTIVDRCGRLDIVLSNAASYKTGSATEITENDWDRTQSVCLKATWMIAHFAVPTMLSQGKGAFIVTGSVHSIRGYAKHAAYQAAKGGLVALTRSLAADYAPQIRVNAILPGAVVTGLWDGIPEEERERIAKMCPLQRNGQPEDIAQAALFLASDMSSYVTGAALVVDGGLTAIVQE